MSEKERKKEGRKERKSRKKNVFCQKVWNGKKPDSGESKTDVVLAEVRRLLGKGSLSLDRLRSEKKIYICFSSQDT